MKTFRRVALAVAATGGLLGALLVPFASPASAKTTQIGTPPGALAHVCVKIAPADTKICIDL
jgi:hypothetical protein